MNLYEVIVSTRVGFSQGTHYSNTPSVHVSARTAEVAAREGQKRGDRWARNEHRWFLNMDKKQPVAATVISVKLIDENWDI